MDRWKAEMGRVREEKRRRKKIKKRKSPKKEDPGARKGRKVAKHCVFPMICGSGGSKSRLAKAAGAEPCGQVRDEKLHAVVARSTFRSKNCTKHVRTTFGSWASKKVHAVVARSPHFQVKITKHHVRTTLVSWDVEKVRAVVARSTFRSQKCKKLTGFGALLEVEMSKKCTPLWREAHFEVKMLKAPHARTAFGRSDVVCVAGARDCAPFQKWAKREGFVAFPKTMAGVGHLKRICKDAFRVAGAVQETCSSEMLGGLGMSGRWFPERGCILEHQICRFAKMILRDRCSTSYDLASLFRGRRSTLDRWSGKIAKRIGTRPSALHSTFHFWRKSRRIASFLMLSTSKIEEVSQNCFVFDVVKFKNWGRLAELLHFWCCQVQKLRKSRRIASFSSLQIDRQTDR